MTTEISPAEAKSRVHAGDEIAFLDVREAGQFGEGHPLFAVPCPFSRLEPMAARLVPNRRVPVVLLDDGDGVAARAAARLEGLGYEDVSTVAGGAPAWAAAGHTLFKGVNVPSKTLGELAEHVWDPPTVDADTLRGWQAEGTARLFDGRPPAEYGKMHVPGAVCMPNGELAHRLDIVAPPRQERIVVGCAGRTRGIVGSIGLRLMEPGREVFAMENGTQGWTLAGHELERGVAADELPPLDRPAAEAARARGRAFLARWNLPVADAGRVGAMLAETKRTTFVFDVRSAAEAAADPVPVARHALGGQLAQAADQYVGVRHARIVLCDDTHVRAGLAAFWLRQLGFEVHVAAIDDELRALPAPAGPAMPALAEAEAPAALQLVREGATLVDLRSSRAYREGHVDGAVWAVRPRLDAVLRGATDVILVADEPDVAACAAADLAAAGHCVAAVRGGHAALVAAGAREVTSPDTPDDEAAIDFLLFVHDRHDGNLEAARRYLAWEQDLIGQLDAEERAEFRLAQPQDDAPPPA